MKQIVSTLKFINDNFLYLFAFALAPAVTLILNFDPAALLFLFNRLWQGGAAITLAEFHGAMGIAFAGRNFLLFVLAAAASILGASLIMSFCDRRMRIGISSFTKPFAKLNENIVAVTAVTLVLLALYELYFFLTSCIFALIMLAGTAAAQVLLPIFALLFLLLYLFIQTIFVQWIPLMMIPGNSLAEALAISAKAVQGRLFSLLLGLVFPLLVTYPIMILARIFLNFLLLDFVICIVCYLFIFTYYCCYTMVTFFDATGRERIDLKNPYRYGR